MMNLKILLPFMVFADIKNVSRVVLETSEGYYGLLPQRLDCVAALVPGIFTYQTAAGVKYIAVDEGLLVKAGAEVWVSVRNAMGGVDLGKLRETVEKEFKEMDDNERIVHEALAKLESGFMYQLEKFKRT